VSLSFSVISLSAVTLLLLVVTGAAVRARFSWWSLFLTASVLEVLGFVLLGLPGAAFLETFEPIMRRVGRRPISGDAAWPAAIVMSLLWPVALAPAYLVARSVPLGNRQRGLVALAVLLTMCLLIGFLVYGMGA
jgi:hypothetical protein